MQATGLEKYLKFWLSSTAYKYLLPHPKGVLCLEPKNLLRTQRGKTMKKPIAAILALAVIASPVYAQSDNLLIADLSGLGVAVGSTWWSADFEKCFRVIQKSDKQMLYDDKVVSLKTVQAGCGKGQIEQGSKNLLIGTTVEEEELFSLPIPGLDSIESIFPIGKSVGIILARSTARMGGVETFAEVYRFQETKKGLKLVLVRSFPEVAGSGCDSGLPDYQGTVRNTKIFYNDKTQKFSIKTTSAPCPRH